MKLLRTTGRGAAEAKRVLGDLERRSTSTTEHVMPVVRRIVNAVRKNGDRALRKYASRLDGLSPQSPLQIRVDQMLEAWEGTAPKLQDALRIAADNIRGFAERQRPAGWNFTPVPGLSTGQIIRPICAAGCYVPSGRHPLPSSLLMTVIPAQVAGVERIVVVSPNPATETLAAAHLLGVQYFYRIGGAQAIGALAYGTETIARVDKIAGPGNSYVTGAKRLVAFDCAIDMLAGPTEIVILSDKGKPNYIAAELIAQAEHDPEALAIFVTTQPQLAADVVSETKQRGKSNPTAKASLGKQGYVFIAASLEEAREITNRLAPEHLTVDDPSDTAWIQNAGSVFIGANSPQAMGDYVSGPNHTLPTGGYARVRGGLSVLDFLKVITVQKYDRSALKSLGPAAIALAEAEGLWGHAEAVRARGIAAAAGKMRKPRKVDSHA